MPPACTRARCRPTSSRVARYDLLCGGVDANATAEIARVRQLNPHILILPYIILRSAEATSSDVPDAWWARDAEGHTFNYWPGSHVLNLLLPSVQDYLVKECEKLLADPHEFDGVFFDGYDQGIGYLNYSHPGDIDLDGDGKRDDHVVRDAKWRAAEQSVIRRVAALRGGTVIVMANTWTFPNWVPANLLHGVLAEDQIRRVRRGQIRLDWFLDGYQRTVANSRQPVVIGVVNGGSELNIRQYLALTHQQQAAEQAKVRANVQAMRLALRHPDERVDTTGMTLGRTGASTGGTPKTIRSWVIRRDRPPKSPTEPAVSLMEVP